jgi:hypothetical protein
MSDGGSKTGAALAFGTLRGRSGPCDPPFPDAGISR